MDLDPARLQAIAQNFLIFIVSLSLHEWGHAHMADRLGDPTPRSQGRVTINPLAHIDPVGTVLLPLLASFGAFGGLGIVGWAKPVMVDPSYYKNRNTDLAWVTIAGPAMNLLLAIAFAVAAGLAVRWSSGWEPFLQRCVTVNVMLIVFNLLPIPPLDGSKFLMYWFGMSGETYAKFARFGLVLLLLFINLPQTRGLLSMLYRAALQPFGVISGIFS